MHVGIKRKHIHDDGIIDGIKILASFKWRIPLLNYQCEIATTSIYTIVNRGKATLCYRGALAPGCTKKIVSKLTHHIGLV